MLLIAGLWLLLAGRLNAHGKAASGQRSRDGQQGHAGRCLLAVGSGGLRHRRHPRPTARFHPPAGRGRPGRRRGRGCRFAAPTGEEHQSHEQEPARAVDYGVPQTAPFWVGQRIRNNHAGRGVVISVQAKDAADPRGSLPGGRWWEVVVEFDQPYVPRPRVGQVRAVRTWTWNVLADRYGRCSRTSHLSAG